MNLEIRPLTPEAFAPFGQVIMGSGKVPERVSWAARTDSLRASARANVTYMSLEGERLPIEITELEKHPYSHQMFVPLAGTEHLVMVCPSLVDGSPDLEKCVAFAASGDQAVNYNADVWHAPRTVLSEHGAFVMLRWDCGTAADTRFKKLEQCITILEDKNQQSDDNTAD